MKYLIELHFLFELGFLFICLSVIVLFIGITLVVIEDSKKDHEAREFAIIRSRWLLPGYLIFWGVYTVSLHFAQSLKTQLPVYQYELTIEGCDVLHRANIKYPELKSKSCVVFGYSNVKKESKRLIYSGGKEVELDTCNILRERLRNFSEYKDEFDIAYERLIRW